MNYCELRRLRAFAVVSLLLMNVVASANDFRRTLAATEFEGWTRDGALMAYTRTNRESNLYGPSWAIDYVVVQDTAGTVPEEVFQLAGSTDGVKETVDRTKWLSGKPIGEWEEFQKKHEFIKPEANTISPSGRWRIGFGLDGTCLQLSTYTWTAVPNPEEAQRDRFLDSESRKHPLQGKILNFSLRRRKPASKIEGDACTWTGFITDGTRKIEFHGKDLYPPTQDFAHEGMDGSLAAYWSPNEDFVNIEWDLAAISGPNPIWLYQTRLPPLKQ